MPLFPALSLRDTDGMPNPGNGPGPSCAVGRAGAPQLLGPGERRRFGGASYARDPEWRPLGRHPGRNPEDHPWFQAGRKVRPAGGWGGHAPLRRRLHDHAQGQPPRLCGIRREGDLQSWQLSFLAVSLFVEHHHHLHHHLNVGQPAVN